MLLESSLLLVLTLAGLPFGRLLAPLADSAEHFAVSLLILLVERLIFVDFLVIFKDISIFVIILFGVYHGGLEASTGGRIHALHVRPCPFINVRVERGVALSIAA